MRVFRQHPNESIDMGVLSAGFARLLTASHLRRCLQNQRMRIIIMFVAVLALASVMLAPVSAQPATATVDEFVSGILSISNEQCRNRGQVAACFDRDGKVMEARGVRLGEATLCDCLPARLLALRERLKRGERAQRLTEAEFIKTYAPRYMNACAAESLRRSYGDGCAESIGARKPNGGKYCACMAAQSSKFTDAEAARLGEESADYASAAAEAKKRGQAEPPRPPMLARLAGIDSTCSEP